MDKLSIIASKSQLKWAKKRADELGALNNSIRSGRGNFIGYLGQIVVAQYFHWEEPDTFDFDIVASDGSRLDVKTKERTVSCKPHYEFSVALYNLEQDCRGYLPLSIYRDRHDYIVEVMGWIPKDQFMSMARRMEKGTRQSNMKRGEIRATCLNLRYDCLIPLQPPLVDWMTHA